MRTLGQPRRGRAVGSSSGSRLREPGSRFPTNFHFGVATSAYQIEGGLTGNNWAEWENRTRPDGGPTILGSDRCGLACDSWERFPDDVRLMQWLGIDLYRFSVEWSRVEPLPGQVDHAALSRYRDWCLGLRAAGIAPMVTLHHFTEPIWVTENGGFENPAGVDAWVRFVQTVAAQLGDVVDLWTTVNEPVGYVVQGWFRGIWPPGRQDPMKGLRVLENLLVAHSRAYRVLHSAAQDRGSDRASRCRVGIAHHIVVFRPRRAWMPLDRLAARVLDRAYNRGALDALATGRIRITIPGLMYRAEHPELRDTQDYLGVNHYYPMQAAVRLRRRDARGLLQVSFSDQPDVDDLGCTLDPSSLRDALELASGYGLPIMVTENGVCDGDDPDERRCRYLASAFHVLGDALRSGIDVRGYVHWSLLDNFEWAHGSTPRFGLFAVDHATLERTPTSGANLYRAILARQHVNPPTVPTRVEGPR